MATMCTSSDSGGSDNNSPRRRQFSSSHSRTYICKVCRNEFHSGQSLGGHMNVHRKDQRSSRNHEEFPRSDSTPHGDQNHSSPSGSVEGGSSDPSTYKGVRYRIEQHKWAAEIRPPKSNKTWWLGTYSTPVEAAYAYDVAINYFGSETSLNFDGHPVYEQIPRISPDLPKQDFAMQLRKVVKEYGKLAMESDHRGEEPPPTSSTTDQYDSPGNQQQEARILEEIDWDIIGDDDDIQGTNPWEVATSYDTTTPFDYEMAPPASNSDPNGFYSNQPHQQFWSTPYWNP